jgi:Zn-dependent protease
VISGGIPLGRFFGISVRLHWSWFLIFALVTWLLGAYYFPDRYPHWSTTTHWITGVGTSILFFSSVLAHELAHSLVAKAAGIQIRSITLFIFGGVSQITKEPEKPGVEFRMAVAGPGTSLILSSVFWGIYQETPSNPWQG